MRQPAVCGLSLVSASGVGRRPRGAAEGRPCVSGCLGTPSWLRSEQVLSLLGLSVPCSLRCGHNTLAWAPPSSTFDGLARILCLGSVPNAMEAARSIVGHQATLKDERHQAQVLNQVLGPSERGALLWGTGRKPVMLAAGPVGG